MCLINIFLIFSPLVVLLGVGKKGPVKKVPVKTVLGKNGPGKKGPTMVIFVL